MRAPARTPPRLLGRTRLVRRHRHTDRRGLPGLRTRHLPAAGVSRAGPRTRPRRASEHRVAVLGEARMRDDNSVRIPAGRFRELGPINWVLAKSAARTVRAPKMHLFATLGRPKRLFLAMMPYSAVLLRGRLPLV